MFKFAEIFDKIAVLFFMPLAFCSPCGSTIINDQKKLGIGNRKTWINTNQGGVFSCEYQTQKIFEHEI